MKKPSKVGIVLASLPVVMMLLLCLWIIWKINDGKEASEGEGLMEMILTFYAMCANLVVYGIYLLVRWFRFPKTDGLYPWAKKMVLGSWGSVLTMFPFYIFSNYIVFFFWFLLALPFVCSFLELLFYLKRKKQWKENTPAID